MKNNAFVIVFLVVFTLFGCDKKEEVLQEEMLKNKTFLFYNAADSVSIYVDFKDSICNEINYDSRSYPWKLKPYEGNDFLIIGEAVYGIKKNEEANAYALTALDYKDRSFTVSEVEPKWDKAALYGEWSNEAADSTIEERGIPLRMPGEIITKEEVWPPKFRIEKDTIYFQCYDVDAKSHYTISNSNAFIMLHLDTTKFGVFHYLWEVVSVDETTLTVKTHLDLTWHKQKYETAEEILVLTKSN